MAQVILSRITKKSFNNLQKCGEIMLDVDDKVYAFNCLFCDELSFYFHSYEEFSIHFEQTHYKELQKLSHIQTTTDITDDEVTEEEICIKQEYETISIADPIEEAELLENNLIENDNSQYAKVFTESLKGGIKFEGTQSEEEYEVISDLAINTVKNEEQPQHSKTVERNKRLKTKLIAEMTDQERELRREYIREKVKEYRKHNNLISTAIIQEGEKSLEGTRKSKRIADMTEQERERRRQYIREKVREYRQRQSLTATNSSKLLKKSRKSKLIAEMTEEQKELRRQYIREKVKAYRQRNSSNKSKSTNVNETTTPDALCNMDDEKLSLLFITEYKKERILWDKDIPFYNTKRSRLEAFARIAENFEKNTNLRLSTNDITKWIWKVRFKYRAELNKHKIAKKKSIAYTPNVYFETLSFLRSYIKGHQKQEPNEKKGNQVEDAIILTEKTDDIVPKRTHIINFGKLIEIYENYPCLWDVDNIGYFNEVERCKTINEMLKHVNEIMELNLTQIELEEILSTLHSICTREKELKLKWQQQTDEKFESNFEFYDQISFMESKISPYLCDICQETCERYNKFRRHYAEHMGVKPFTCPICNFSFTSMNVYKIHARRHLGDMPYKCTECEKSYAQPNELRLHMRKHTGLMPYFCEKCGKLFRNKHLFEDHKTMHENNPKYECYHCSKKFFIKYQLRRHEEIHKEIRDKVCDICGKSYKTSKNLQAHKRIHTKPRKFDCNLCKKSFTARQNLKLHLKTHGIDLCETKLDNLDVLNKFQSGLK